MKRIITKEIKSILEKRNSGDTGLEPQKSTIDFLKNFARVYHVPNVTLIKNQAFILN